MEADNSVWAEFEWRRTVGDNSVILPATSPGRVLSWHRRNGLSFWGP